MWMIVKSGESRLKLVSIHALLASKLAYMLPAGPTSLSVGSRILRSDTCCMATYSNRAFSISDISYAGR
jgi:hypothetical protein